MKAVYEELHGNEAVFILDDVAKVYHVDVSLLPEGAVAGDVFQVQIEGASLVIGEKLDNEREKRLLSAQEKREQLLKRRQSE